MFKDKFFRTWSGPFPFTESAIRLNAPARSGLYQLLYEGNVVYIGISTDSIRGRLLKHVKGHGNWAAARRSKPEGYEFVFYECDGQTAKQIESNVVTNEKPPFNVKPEYKNYIDSIMIH